LDVSEFENRGFGPEAFRVCLENVADFVDATGDDRTRWTSAAPPGFVSTALFVVASDLLAQLSDHSVIHGEQTFEWLRPFGMESDLEVEGTVSRVRERGGVRFVNFDLAVGDGEGPVSRGSSLFLLSEKAGGMTSTETVEPAASNDGGPGGGQVSASRADLVRYAAATRDWNPIHWDHDAAVAAGLPGVVSHGLLQASWAFAHASRLRQGDRPLSAAKVRFRNPLPPAVPADIAVQASDGQATVSISGTGGEYTNVRIELADE
jgi:acyl dehydratase